MSSKCFFEYVIVGLGFFCLAIRLLEITEWTAIFIIGGIIPILYWFYCLEVNVSDNDAHQIQIYNRPCESHGLWAGLLFPLALFVPCHVERYHCSDFHSIISSISIPLLASTCHWLYDLPVIRRKSHSVYSFITTSVSFIVFLYNDYHVFTALSGSIILHLTFYFSLHALLTLSPKSFTIGEAIIVAQSISVFCLSTWLNLIRHIVKASEYNEESAAVVHVSQISVMGAGIFGVALVYGPVLRKTLFFYISAFAIAGIFIIPTLYWLLQQNPLLWFLHFVFTSTSRIVLLIFWSAATIASILIVSSKENVSQEELTICRKYFHGMAVLIFASGILFDQHLTYIASGVTFGLFLIVEFIRLLKMPPIGIHINDGFSKFVDDKDPGQWILTHFYLLVGCSLPLWLIPEFSSDVSIATFSGVLSVGVGDAVASIIGKKFGVHCWPGVKKTIEGTLSSILIQSLLCILLWLTGTLQFTCWWMVVCISLTAILEAFTFQIDNLVLSLYLFILSII